MSSSGRSVGNGPSEYSAVSNDGRFVAFSSAAGNLVTGDNNSNWDIFVWDRIAGTTRLVSVSSAGVQGNDRSHGPVISDDGRYVAFSSYASTLVPGDTNDLIDVFVHDVHSRTTRLVSVASDGTQGNGNSFDVDLSGDGQKVIFFSGATNLHPDSTTSNTYVHDLVTGTTDPLVRSATGEVIPVASGALSASGRAAAFVAGDSPSLDPNDDNSTVDVYVIEFESGEIERVSVSSEGVQGRYSLASLAPDLSADGRMVVFESDADNLVPGDSNNQRDIFVRDRVTGTTERVSLSSAGEEGSWSWESSISADGTKVAFRSSARNFVPDDTNDHCEFNGLILNCEDIFVRDLTTDQTTRVSLSSNGKEGNGDSTHALISNDGRYVTFTSLADNFVRKDTNDESDVFLRRL